jgi:hypothetical protein
MGRWRAAAGAAALMFLSVRTGLAQDAPGLTIQQYSIIPSVGDLSGAPGLAVDSALGHVYTVSDDGTVAVFDTNGSLVGQVALTPWDTPYGTTYLANVVVDLQTHHFFVMAFDTVKIIDGISLTELESISLPARLAWNYGGTQANAYSSVDHRLYLVTTSNFLLAIDLSRPPGDPERIVQLPMPFDTPAVAVVNDSTKVLYVAGLDSTGPRAIAIVDVDTTHTATYQTVVTILNESCEGDASGAGGGSVAKALSIDRRRNLLYCAQPSDYAIYAVDVDPSRPTFAQRVATAYARSTTTDSEEYSVFVDPVGGVVYLLVTAVDQVYPITFMAFDEISLTRLSEMVLSGDFEGVGRIAADPSTGHVYVATSGFAGGPHETSGNPALVVLAAATNRTVVVASDSVVEPVTVNSPEVSITFSDVTAAGTTTVQQIDPSSLNVTLPAQFSIAGATSYEINTSAIVLPPFTLCFNASNVSDAIAFAALAVVHGENGTWVDRTTSHDFSTGTICASVTSFSPFALAHRIPVHYGINALYDQTKAAKSGSTIPIKLQVLSPPQTNASSAGLQVIATSVSRLSTNVSTAVADSGDANPDSNFRYDATLGGYIFNLSTRGLSAGTYAVIFTIDGDPTTHSVQFGVKP